MPDSGDGNPCLENIYITWIVLIIFNAVLNFVLIYTLLQINLHKYVDSI